LIATCASAHAQTRGVIELFTSQGCSSCPPADRLMGELARDPSLVVISVPIDYWDYLGWKDTLAEPRHTARQKAYARGRGDGQVYTPQAVISGSVHTLGSDLAAIEKAIAATSKAGAMSLSAVTISLGDGRIHISVPERAAGAANAETWLCGVMRAVSIPIGRGENKGLTVTYHNVARRWVKLGDWSGRAKSWSVPISAFAGEGVDEAVVLVQSGSAENPKMILGAAIAALR
jgi:hypothetical protein